PLPPLGGKHRQRARARDEEPVRRLQGLPAHRRDRGAEEAALNVSAMGLAERLPALFREQAASWPLLARGLEGLAASRTRSLSVRIAEALPGSFAIYNGAECGASAPDHLHFQAASRAGLPLFATLSGARGGVELPDGRTVLVFRGAPRRVEEELAHAIDALARSTRRAPEPWVNLAAFDNG